ncbi:TLDc domain-containing protein [Entamoeba marina]
MGNKQSPPHKNKHVVVSNQHKFLLTESYLITNSPSPVHNTTFNYSECIELLYQWTELHSYSVLYNSNTMELSARTFNSMIEGHKNVMIIIVTTRKYVFGCFCSNIPHPAPRIIQVKNDAHFFLFTLNNPLNIRTKMCQLYGKKKSLILHPNSEQQFISSCFNAFWVCSDSTVHVDKGIHSYYEISENISITNSYLPSHSTLQTLLALEWSE